jgi:hypothetical protein
VVGINAVDLRWFLVTLCLANNVLQWGKLDRNHPAFGIAYGFQRKHRYDDTLDATLTGSRGSTRGNSLAHTAQQEQ